MLAELRIRFCQSEKPAKFSTHVGKTVEAYSTCISVQVALYEANSETQGMYKYTRSRHEGYDTAHSILHLLFIRP